MKPFLRWPGGKAWIADLLVEEIVATKPTQYIEPFLGAGAVALAMPSMPMLLGDYSPPLMNLWRFIMSHPKVLALQAAQLLAKFGNREEGYYEARRLFNQYPHNGPRSAALMLYLNTLCFNGLWRENKSGFFNVPFGRIVNASTPSAKELDAVSAHLAACNAKLAHASFEGLIDEAGQGSAVFVDPPYDSGYNSYVADGFGSSLQEDLAHRLHLAVQRGARVWATNNDTPLIRSAYSWATISPLSEPRSIAAKGSSRKRAACVLIRGGL